MKFRWLKFTFFGFLAAVLLLIATWLTITRTETGAEWVLGLAQGQVDGLEVGQELLVRDTQVREVAGEFGCRIFVDSAPGLEKALARNAGLLAGTPGVHLGVDLVGGEEIRRWTSRAPALRSMVTSLIRVVPRTIESSTMTSLLPSMASLSGFSLSLIPCCRLWSVGEMKVRPT